MTPISKEIQKDISGKLSRQIEKILHSPDLKNLTEEQIEKLAKSVIIDNLKEQLKTEVKKSTLDIDQQKDKWLSTFNSKITRLNYKHNVDEFLAWLGKRSIIDFKAIDADDYLTFLNNSNLKPGTIRFRIAAASSFCNYLKRIDVIHNNYFLKIKGLPRIKHKQKNIPSDQDIEAIEQELQNEMKSTGKGSAGKQRSARMMLTVLSLIKSHALRIGAFETFTIANKNQFIADTKGSEVRGILNNFTLSLIRESGLNTAYPFSAIKVSSLKKQFERFLGRLFMAGKILHVYSPHDLRHYAAIKYYQNTKDIYATMRFLNHKNIATTQIYLTGLGIINQQDLIH